MRPLGERTLCVEGTACPQARGGSAQHGQGAARQSGWLEGLIQAGEWWVPGENGAVSVRRPLRDSKDWA